MTLYNAFAALIVLTALFAYINHRFIKLPSTIGLMLLGLVFSLLIIGLGAFNPFILQEAAALVAAFDFSELLLGSMLSFMLFAGAIHIPLADLRQTQFSVLVFSTFSVVLSTFIIGTAMYYLLALFGIPTPFIYCLLFGSLISPTDPIAVLGILKDANVSKSLEMKMAGESLFNDGVAVVVFLTILEAAAHPEQLQASQVALLFAQEAVGGLLMGLAIGYLGFLLMRSIDNYKVEVLLSLAVVMGGYAFSTWLHVSGPLAMVAAGILIGNQGKAKAMSKQTIEYIDKFWELIDEILNALLFVLIGLVLLNIEFEPIYALIGLISIPLVLLTRYLSLLLPAQLVKLREDISQRTILLLTWGGLRGGISIALALSLQENMQKELWVTLTYFVVAFSILVQGLTVGRVAKRLRAAQPIDLNATNQH